MLHYDEKKVDSFYTRSRLKNIRSAQDYVDREESQLSRLKKLRFFSPANESQSRKEIFLFSSKREWATPVLILACVALSAFIFLYAQSKGENKMLAKLLAQERSKVNTWKGEASQWQSSFGALEVSLQDKSERIQNLEAKIRERNNKVQTLEKEKRDDVRSLEKKYRDELMQLSAQYEAKLSAVSDALKHKDAELAQALAKASKVQEIVTKQHALSFFENMNKSTFASRVQGAVKAIHARQGFFEVDIGLEQGAVPGRGVVFMREGTPFASGKIDRAYPTSSAVVAREVDTIYIAKKGDTVLLS